MKKRNYLKPAMNIVELRHRTNIMATSGVEASRSSYGVANEGVESSEIKDGAWAWE